MSDKNILDPQSIKKDLNLIDPSMIHPETSESSLNEKADSFVEKILNLDPTQHQDQSAGVNSVENLGTDVQKQAADVNHLLRSPLKNMSERSQDGSEVSNALISLKMKVEELDPGKIDMDAGWFSRTIGRIPGVGSPLKRYFSKFESSQTVIAAIVRSLEHGKDQLQRDNITLAEDQNKMRKMTGKLEQVIKVGQLIDQKMSYKLEREIKPEDPRHKFISEELIFPLRQRIIDLQQQLAVNQQGVLASELIIRNNKELVRGVSRSLQVTVNALQVGATVAMALANQKIVLEKLDSVSKTTSDLIASTAARLKTQGVEIQKQASGAQLNIESLRTAFADIEIAIKDISEFRIKALPQMASTILEMDQLSNKAESMIKKIEEGNKKAPEIKLDLD